MARTVLVLESISVRYDAVCAVDGVSLAVRAGEVVGLLGPNGCGKSTTLAAAAGLIVPAAGRVIVDAVDSRIEPAAFAKKIGFVPQDAALYDELTAKQNLAFFGRLQGLRGDDLARRVDRALGTATLLDRADERVNKFSGGMRQRLNIACAGLHDPAVILLDEPTASLDSASRAALHVELARLRDAGGAILMTTHLDEDAVHCDRVVRMAGGRVVEAAVLCMNTMALRRSRPFRRAFAHRGVAV
jgi:ABC-2 type transport system ATP-binding protein